MPPQNPNEPDNYNTYTILQFAPGAAGVANMHVEDSIGDDLSQSRERTLS